MLLTEEDMMVGFSGGVGRAEAAVDPSPLWMIGFYLREMTTTACSRYNTITFTKQNYVLINANFCRQKCTTQLLVGKTGVGEHGTIQQYYGWTLGI